VNFEAYRFLIPRFWPDVVEIVLVAFVIYRFRCSSWARGRCRSWWA